MHPFISIKAVLSSTSSMLQIIKDLLSNFSIVTQAMQE